MLRTLIFLIVIVSLFGGMISCENTQKNNNSANESDSVETEETDTNASNDNTTDSDPVDDTTDTPSYISSATTIPSRFNRTQNGAWWGSNIIKIVRGNNMLFTYAMDKDIVPTTTHLYSKRDNGTWNEGEAFKVSRPPNILIDSNGYIHLIGHQPFDDDLNNDWKGRLFYVKFDTPHSVSGAYSFEYITPDWRENSDITTYATYYCGAAIGSDDVIVVVYNTSEALEAPHSLSARIYDPVSGNWDYDIVTSDDSVRLAYPHVAITEDYFHVLAVEDDYDPDLDSTGYAFRYGFSKHFQRARNETTWEESILVDFNNTLTDIEISKIFLDNSDLYVDSTGNIQVLIKYQKDGGAPHVYQYTKPESGTTWVSEQVRTDQHNWGRFWENEEGQLFVVLSSWSGNLTLLPQGEDKSITISNMENEDKQDPTPFVANTRGGTSRSSKLDIVVFSGMLERETLVVEVDYESQR